MATKLEKDLTRESSIEIDGRNILVTITKDQTISLKLKGMKSGVLEIPIQVLYNQLSGSEPKQNKKIKVDDSEPIINLHDFRSQYMIHADLPLDVKTKLESITVNLIKNLKIKK